ncbi:Z1 domain-containing protein [Streptomyces rochei]|uniref:Z1 domain-containing protein n=1 Tax=Streptomyces rochei TaxID=1928 RepID=UPI003400EB5F
MPESDEKPRTGRRAAPRPAALDRAVSAARAASGDLDAQSLAEVLWLASRMAAASTGTPDGNAEVPAAPAPSAPTAQSPAPVSLRSEVPRPATLPVPPRDRDAVRPLHERLPGSAARVRGHAVGVPRAVALPLALHAARAMRPWKRPWPVGRRRTLDLSATVDGYARSGELIPFFTAGPERWFDLVLVVDRSPSMQVWQETVDAFTAVLVQLGAFRTLQVLELGFDADSGIELRDRQGRLAPPGRLRAPHGRQLVLTVSDCASDAWQAPGIWEHLRTWARTTPVALLNPLPTKLWRRTGLDLPTVRVAPGPPGASNAELAFTLPPLLPAGEKARSKGEWLPLPVLSLSPHSLDRWSRAVMQAAPEGCAAVLMPPGGRVTAHGRARPAKGGGDEARAEGFLHTAAPAAARLAVVCSPFDRLSLALVHLIRQELVPEATTADVAEVLTSGLFPLDNSPDGSVTLVPSPAARTRLGQDLAQYDVWRLNRALSRRIPAQSDARGRLPAVVRGAYGTREFLAESRPFGHALERTLELLGLAAPDPNVAEEQDDEAATADADTAALPQEPGTSGPDSARFALRLALALLPPDRQPTAEELADSVRTVETVLAVHGHTLNVSALTREIQARTPVFMGPPVSLDDGIGHTPWLDRGPQSHTQDFWERYRRYLQESRNWSPYELHRLDESTDGVLGRLEDPRRSGAWRRSGLVIAPAGSGRTTHFIGLAAKAVDAGYRLIVVLAGASNAVRSQTQLRVDEGLVGFDTTYTWHSGKNPTRIGAGALPHAKALPIASLTNSTEQGDFAPRTAVRVSPLPTDGMPLVLVIKKNRRTIDTLRTWLRHSAGAPDPAAGRGLFSETPLLVIDAVDGSRGKTAASARGDRSSVHADVCDLVSDFAKAAYVSYASTPFAALIDAADDSPGGLAGPFPHNFVYSLPVPSNYLGPERVFGSPGNTPGSLESESLPLVRLVGDQEPWMPVRHRATHVPDEELPGSLLTALDAFVLACAARRARGQVTAHNSMLVSVSRFISVQDHVRRQLAERVSSMVTTLRDRHNPASSLLMEELRQVWVGDFQPTTEGFPGTGVPSTSWAEVAPHVEPAVRKIRVMAFNSASGQAPAYHEHAEDGLSVVAVGGAKLEQEGALNGLTVGYHLRSSSTYDALMRMADWFGYRVGYEDLCRLYTTPDLVDAYQELTSATGELRQELQQNAEMGLAPQELALRLHHTRRVRDVLASYERPSETLSADYSGRTAETLDFNLSPDLLNGNLRVLQRFVRSLDALAPGAAAPVNGSIMWRGVPAETVLAEFLDVYLPSPPPARERSQSIAEYVRWRAAQGALGSWTVQLIGRPAAAHALEVAGHLVGLVRRAPVGPVAPAGIYTVRRLLSPGDACKDLDADQFARAMEITRSRAAARRSRIKGDHDAAGTQPHQQLPTTYAIQEVRRPDQPLLTIYPLLSPIQDGEEPGTPVVGYAASFPRTARTGMPLWLPR